MSQLQKAVVRSLPGDANLTITLTVGGRQRNLDRPKDELLEKPLRRLQQAGAPGHGKQKRSKPSGEGAAPDAAAFPSPPAPLLVALHEGPSAEHPLVDPTAVSNAAAWQQGRLLRVGDASYAVQLNPPMADGLSVHGTPFAGVPLVPVPQLHFAEVADCEWEWHRRRRGAAAWEPVAGATSRQYTPVQSDAGCMVRAVCTPVQRGSIRGDARPGQVLRGEPVSCECGPVAVPPAPSAAEGRQQYTSQYTRPPRLRVLTYNILADQYAATDTARNVLFSHCPPRCLQAEYRRPLVLAEVLAYRPDVAALQEVDDRMFSQCLAPALGEAGYEGAYLNKVGKVREGAAVFWRRERYELAARRDVALKGLFPAEAGGEAKYAAVFEPMLSTSQALRAALQRVGTVAQLLLLVPPGAAGSPVGGGASGDDPALRPLCVVNTHLFFHYAAPHIRSMHVWAILQEAKELVDAATADPELRRRCGGRRPALLFCGDLNSDLNDGIPGAIELLASGRLPADHWDWQFGVAFKWDKDEEEDPEAAPAPGGAAAAAEAGAAAKIGAAAAGPGGAEAGGGEGGELLKMVHTEVEGKAPAPPRSRAEVVAGVDLASPFCLRAADGLRSAFTNHVRGYQGLLDYVWYEPWAMAVRAFVPLPTERDIGGYLPSPRFPSDHLAVVAELEMRAEAGGPGTGPENAGSGGGALPSDGGGALPGDGGGTLPAAQHNVGLAAGLLRGGGLLAVPTDTVYGLAACASDEAAVQRIYALKRRDAGKPVAICVADPGDVARYAEVAHLPPALIPDLLPGPVTLLLARRRGAPLAAGLNPGVPTIGVRVPDHLFLRAVCRQHRGALALTSANLSGQPSSVAVEEFLALWPSCAAVFDGGETGAGREGSTVVDLTLAGQFAIVRRGAGLDALLHTLRVTHGLRDASSTSDRRRSPGGANGG